MTDFEAIVAGQHLRADPVPRSARLLLCFTLAVLAMLPTQFYRLAQDEALPWILADYAGRLMAIGVLFVLPAGRWCLKQRDELKVGTLEAVVWVIGIVAFFQFSGIDQLVVLTFPQQPLGAYSAPKGLLYAIDITLGLALVSLHEELIFRKLAGQAMQALGWGPWRIVLVSALLFGLFHWWRAPSGMIGAATYGVLAMICYRRTGSLWPIGFAHYLLDYIAFA